MERSDAKRIKSERSDASKVMMPELFTSVSRIELRAGSNTRSQRFGLPRFKAAHAFVVLQVTLSSVLNPENLILMRTDARLAGYQPERLFPLYRQIHDKLNAIPGVASASIAA